MTGNQAGQLHQAYLGILENTGVQPHEQEAVDLLRDAGCRVEDDSLVQIPQGLVEYATGVAPEEVTI